MDDGLHKTRHFTLADDETHKLIGVYRSLIGALRDVADTVRRYGRDSAEVRSLVLIRDDLQEDHALVARGLELADLALSHGGSWQGRFVARSVHRHSSLDGEAARKPMGPSCCHAYFALVARVQACRRCPSMEGRRRVLSWANGRPGSAVLFVGEAPGRLGGDRTGVPFHGDQSGRRFEALLGAAGWTRDEVFVTNAVVCNPRTSDGRNRPPDRRELANCRQHLLDTIKLVNPRVVIALGQRALVTLGALHPHGLTLRGDIARPAPWLDGCLLVALYHPGARAAVHRPFSQQVDDWRRVRDVLLTGATSTRGIRSSETTRQRERKLATACKGLLTGTAAASGRPAS